MIGASHVLLGMVLDDGGRDVACWLGGLALAGVVLLAMLASVPVLLLGTLSGGLPQAAAAARERSVPRTGLETPAQSPSAQVDEARVVEVARRYLGIPYVFGGSNPAVGLDCSGLVQLVFRQRGIPLPRTAQLQYNATPRVARDALRPGDLVFFARTYADPNDWITHVGIYVGGGMQINAPTEGQVVSIQPVFSGFWGAHYAGAGRVAGG